MLKHELLLYVVIPLVIISVVLKLPGWWIQVRCLCKKITFKDPIPEKWKNEPVKYLIRYRIDEPPLPDFIVYIDHEDDINWVKDINVSEGENNDDTNRQQRIIENALNEETFMEMEVRSWDTGIKFQVSRLLGEVITSAFCEQSEEEVKKAIQRVRDFIDVRKVEVSRIWIIRYAFFAVFSMFGLAAVFHFCITDKLPLLPIVFVIGSVGAFYSLLMRIGRFSYDSISEKKTHFYEAFARIAVGAISGLVSLWIIKIGLIMPSFFNETNEASVLLFAFIAGASERLLPGIISAVENAENKKSV